MNLTSYDNSYCLSSNRNSMSFNNSVIKKLNSNNLKNSLIRKSNNVQISFK